MAGACTRSSDDDVTLPSSDARPGVVRDDEQPDVIPDAESEALLAEQDYQWSVLSSGAGGFVTGLDSNADGSVLLARTDVGGVYKWDAAGSAWRQLLSFEGVMDPAGSDWEVEAMAIAPSDPNRLYLSTGDSLDAAEGRVLASSDGGATWTAAAQQFAIHGNGDWRDSGERLAVDPSDADVVLLGTRTEGLWRSVDGGNTFNRIESVPVGTNAAEQEEKQPAGVLFVIFAADGSAAWAGVSGVGVMRSVDGGQTWTTLAPSAGMPFDAEEGVDGRLWVAQRDPGVVWVIDGDNVADVSPGGNRRYETITVDPFDPNRVIVGGVGIANDLWQTTDGGADWSDLTVSTSCESIPWLDLYPNDFLPTGSLRFDRTVPNQVWVPEGFAVWRAEVGVDTFAMGCEARGIEEMVSNDVVVPPGGDPITAHWDRGLFWHGGEVSEAAKVHPANRFNSAWDLDWTPADPNFVVAVIGDQRGCCRGDEDSFLSAYSEDGGETWTPFGSYANGHPSELVYGNIAISASDKNNIVWLPTFNRPPFFTTDGGQTWTPVEPPGTDQIRTKDDNYAGGSHFQYYLNRKVLVADRIEPSTFYLYHSLGLFRSTDGGASWELLASEGLPLGGIGVFNAQLVASPVEAGHLLFSPSAADAGAVPTYESRDGGATWRTVPGLSDVTALGFGAPLADGGPAAVYLSGAYDGARGIWRSVDGLVTFELISRAPLGNYQSVRTITGDESEPGAVYLGFEGTSFMVGKLEPIEEG